MRSTGKLGAVALLLLVFGAGLACATPPRASEVLNEARAEAAAQHKNIFFTFNASWCGPCHRLEMFVNAPQIAPLLQKYFVFAKLNVAEEHGEHPELENPGAEKLLVALGGENTGIPFIFFLDADGNKLADSNRPVEGKTRFANVGYPDTPEEIAWFMAMLKKGAPGMTDEERRMVDGKLRLAGRIR